MAYVVRFSDGSKEFDLDAPSFESAMALVEFLENAKVAKINVGSVDGSVLVRDRSELKAQSLPND